MKTDVSEQLLECVRKSASGTLSFPQFVARLTELGVERYHTDYTRQEVTYYLTSGESLVVSAPHDPHETGQTFSPAAVASAVGQSQRGEHTYADFVRKTLQAGCVGYFAQITGRKVIYFGRNGDSHTEHMPQP